MVTTYTKTITSDAYIGGVVAINSDAYIKKLATEKTITSDSYIKKLATHSSIYSNAYIKLTTYSSTIDSNNYLLKNYGGLQLATDYPSLVSLYRMNEASWSGVPGEISDSKGSNDARALGGATTTEGLFDKAGTFSGTNTGISCGDNSTFHTTNISVSLWAYPTAATNTYNDIINTGKYRVILRSTKKIEFWVYSSTMGWVQAVSDSSVDLNKWVHIAATYDGTARLYINGALQGTTGSGVVGITWAGNSIFIGQSGADDNEYAGKLDDVSFFNTAISLQDIQSISKQNTFLFSNDYIKKIDTTKTITSDSYIFDTYENTINSNSLITKTFTKNKISDLFIKKIDNEETLTSDGWIKLISTNTLDSNSEIKKAYSKTINSNLYIFKEGYEGTISSNSYIKKLATTETLNSNSYISDVESNTLTSNSYILNVTEKTLNSDLYIFNTYDKSLNSNAFIIDTYENTVSSDSYVLDTQANTLTSNSYIIKVTEETILSTLFITKNYTKILTSDSFILKSDNENILSSDYYILKVTEKTLNSDSYLSEEAIEGSLNSNSFIKKINDYTLNSNAKIQLGGFILINSNYSIINAGLWSEEWGVDIYIPSSVIISGDLYIKQSYSKTINSNSHLLREELEGIASNYYIKTTYTNNINTIYYIRRTDTTKPYVYAAEYINKPVEYEAEYINKPVIISANSLSYDEIMI